MIGLALVGLAMVFMLGFILQELMNIEKAIRSLRKWQN